MRATLLIVCGATIAAALTACAAHGRGVPRPRTSISWNRCGGALDCARIAVPLDRARPHGETITLALARHRASHDRIGVLLVNPGGPGAPALDLARRADKIFPNEVVARFDIVAWDPRGTGDSTAVSCTRKLDRFFAADRTPDSQREIGDNVAVARGFAASCARGSGTLLAHLSTRETVEDMERIRVALGEAKISYLGWSYGTYIGARYAQLHGTRLRAVVLDGAVDPALDPDTSAIEQSRGFDQALAAFLAACARDRQCAFRSGGDPETALDRLLAAIDAEPLPAEIDGEARTLGPGEADIGLASALYAGRPEWPHLASALAAAARGDGSALLRYSDEYTGRIGRDRYDGEQAAFYAIACLEAPAPPSVGAVEQLAARAGRAARHFGASGVWLGLPCTYWPAAPDAMAGPASAPPSLRALVVGTANDPATPLKWARALRKQLHASLLVLDDEGHTAYARGNDCIDGNVDRYLLELRLPADGTSCGAR